MITRKAKPEDREGIAKVLMSGYNITSIEEGMSAFEEELKKGCSYIVAEENGVIIGLTSWKMHGLPKHQLAELDRIAVLPEFRGRGVSQELFKKLLEDAESFYRSKSQRLRKLFLCTHASNQRAQAFYKKLGFRHEATLKDHYYNGEDEMVFSMFFEDE